MTSPNLTLRAADNIRVLSAAMVEKAKSGHPGGPMGGADFMHILYSEFLQFDPDDMTWPLRDRFYLDAGHMSAMLYSTLALTGHYTIDDLKAFRQWGSVTPGHPEVDMERGIENTSGPLGLGHAFGIGSAIAEQFLVARMGQSVAHKTYIYISDGGIQEEISQGAGRIAGHLGLGNITMFYDANDIQLSTEVDDVTGEDTAKKYEAWGWHVMTIDGHDHDAIRQALTASHEETDRPSLIIAKTIMGKGVKDESGSAYESKVELHGKPLGKSNASFEKTIEGLGADPANPFVIFEDVQAHYAEILAEKRNAAQARKQAFAAWQKDNPELAEQWNHFISGDLPDLDFEGISQQADSATRNTSAAVLSYMADHVDNMIVASADLCNSDKTEAFLKKTTAFKKGDFSGAFLQAGVSELTMAALSTGMALHGGVIPVCATFFAFSDYMKPAIRVAALMEQRVIFVWTHDAFRVGEDGPTHQPIEQEAQIRLLEKLKNHSGNIAFMALRPADGIETNIAWKMAVEHKAGPSGLILSRQNIPDITIATRDNAAKGAAQGAYIVYEDQGGNPDLILVANGSELSTICEAAEIVKSQNPALQLRIVSVPSEGVFRTQPEAYQQSVLPEGVKKFGLTAGLPVNLQGLVGTDGYVWGLDHFGYSAPYTVLDQEFGFTPDQVAAKIKDFMS